MKKTLIISAISLLAGMSFSSCEDYLTAENKSSGGNTADDYFSTASGVAAYRVYAYSLLKPLVDDSYINMYDHGTDLYWMSRGKSHDEFTVYGTLTVDNSTVQDYYENCYALINAANGVINYGGSTYESEMKFLRSYAYFMLSQQFGQVPITPGYINNAERSYPLSSLKEVYDYILNDLDAVIADANIPETSTDGTVNKQGARALAARVALAAGWDLGTEISDANAPTGSYSTNGQGDSYFTRAISYADAALSGISLLNFAEKWDYNNQNNAEMFFSVQYDRSVAEGQGLVATGGHGLQNDYASYYGTQSDNGMRAGSSDNVASSKSIYLWESIDERYASTFAITHYNYDGSSWPTTGYYAQYNVDDPSTLPVAYYFAPVWMSEDEVKAYIQTMLDKGLLGTEGYKIIPSEVIHLGREATAYKVRATGIESTDSYVYKGDEVSGSLLFRVNGVDAVKKWDDPNTPISNNSNTLCYRNIPILHAGETYLTRAEAKYMSGDAAGALADINAIRARSGASNLASFAAYQNLVEYNTYSGSEYTTTDLDVILDERARELYAEPGRWMDLRRTKQLVKYYNTFNCDYGGSSGGDLQSTATGEYKWYRPFPQEEINANEGIDENYQNAGY